MNSHTFFACDSIKDNRCWECLEGTKIKDYFIIWIPLGREVLHFILSCTERSKQHLILLMLWQFWSWASDREWMLFNLGELSVLENSVNYLCVPAQSASNLETQGKLQVRVPKRHWATVFLFLRFRLIRKVSIWRVPLLGNLLTRQCAYFQLMVSISQQWLVGIMSLKTVTGL